MRPVLSPHITQPENPSSLPGYLTTADISARDHVSQEHVRLLARQGKLPGSVKVGHDWLISEAAWEEYNKKKGPQGAPRGPREEK